MPGMNLHRCNGHHSLKVYQYHNSDEEDTRIRPVPSSSNHSSDDHRESDMFGDKDENDHEATNDK